MQLELQRYKTSMVEKNANEAEEGLPLEHILQFIPVYPYMFTLLRVSKQWNIDIKNMILPHITNLNTTNYWTIPGSTEYRNISQNTPNYAEQFNMTEFLHEVPNAPQTITSITLHQHDVETFQLEQFINLEKIQIIVSPYHTNIKHTLYQRGLLSKLKTTAKSITMINMRVSTHDSAISPSIKNISFVHCFIGASFSSRTIPNVTLSFQDCVTGVQRSEMENIKFLEFMRQYGFNVGYMIGNSVSYALQKNQKELFHYLWTTLVEQAKNKEKISIPIPQIQDFLHGYDYTKELIEMVTADDVPKSIRGDFEIAKFGTKYQLTLLGHAIANCDFEMVEYYSNKGFKLFVPGTTNPLVPLLSEYSVHDVSMVENLEKIVKLHPLLLSAGDENGMISENVTNEFKPQFLVNQDHHVDVLAWFRQQGLPLHVSNEQGTLLYNKCIKYLPRLVKCIVYNTPMDSVSSEACVLTLAENKDDTRISKTLEIFKIFHTRYGSKWMRNLRCSDGANLLQKTAIFINRENYIPMLEFLITDVGIDPNAPHDMLPLEHLHRVVFLPTLLELGFDPFIGETHVLERLFAKGTALKEALECGIDTNTICGKKNETIYHMYLKHAKAFDVDKNCIADYQKPDDNGVTPFMMMYASKFMSENHWYVYQKGLLRYLASVSVLNSTYITPAEYLKQIGADDTRIYKFFTNL